MKKVTKFEAAWYGYSGGAGVPNGLIAVSEEGYAIEAYVPPPTTRERQPLNFEAVLAASRAARLGVPVKPVVAAHPPLGGAPAMTAEAFDSAVADIVCGCRLAVETHPLVVGWETLPHHCDGNCDHCCPSRPVFGEGVQEERWWVPAGPLGDFALVNPTPHQPWERPREVRCVLPTGAARHALVAFDAAGPSPLTAWQADKYVVPAHLARRGAALRFSADRIISERREAALALDRLAAEAECRRLGILAE